MWQGTSTDSLNMSYNAHDEDTRGMKECAVADTGKKLSKLFLVTDFGRNATSSP